MYNVKKVNEDLYWIGASDRRLALFENIYPIPRGVSYNSYVILDEQTVLLDTVDKAVSGQFFAHPGEPMLLTLTKDTVSVTVSGAAVEKAANRAATQENVKKQLQKLGNTPFVLKELTCDMSDTLFLSNKELNELRRKAVCRLEEVLLSGRKRTMREADGRAVKEVDSRISAKPAADKQALAEKQRPLQVQIAHPYQLKALVPDELLDRIYVT